MPGYDGTGPGPGWAPLVALAEEQAEYFESAPGEIRKRLDELESEPEK